MTGIIKDNARNPVFWLQVGWYCIGWTLLLFTIWFIAFFTPTVSVKTELTVKNHEFEFVNWSYKSVLSKIICGKPSSAVLIFEDPELRFTSNVLDNATGFGAGDERVRQWVSTGHVPETLPKNVMIAVKKRLVYPCLGFNKEYDTNVHTFYNTSRDGDTHYSIIDN